MRSVAFLIAASPTDAFYSQIAALNARLRFVNWSNWRPSLHLFVGGDRRSDTVDEWRPYLTGVHISWTSEELFAREGDWAQSDEVFRLGPPEADVLVALDADTFPVTTFEPMLDRVVMTGAVAGVIAHYPPVLTTTPNSRAGLGTGGPTRLRDVWSRLAEGVTDAPLDFAYAHSLLGPEHPPEHRVTPFYLNFGVVAFPRAVFNAIAPLYLNMRQKVLRHMESIDFSGQVALTLAIAEVRARTWALPLRYNFPNDPVAEAMYPEELREVAIIHYLRTNQFDRHRVFATPEAYGSFLAQPLSGVNQVFRDAVSQTLGTRYPFPRDDNASPLRHT